MRWQKRSGPTKPTSTVQTARLRTPTGRPSTSAWSSASSVQASASPRGWAGCGYHLAPVPLALPGDAHPPVPPTGQHRSLGSNISKVQSLKLDTSVWSNEIVQVEALRVPGAGQQPHELHGDTGMLDIPFYLLLALTVGLSPSSSSCWAMTEPTDFGLPASPPPRLSTQMPVPSRDGTSSPASTGTGGTACPIPTTPPRRKCSR